MCRFTSWKFVSCDMIICLAEKTKYTISDCHQVLHFCWPGTCSYVYVQNCTKVKFKGRTNIICCRQNTKDFYTKHVSTACPFSHQFYQKICSVYYHLKYWAILTSVFSPLIIARFLHVFSPLNIFCQCSPLCGHFTAQFFSLILHIIQWSVTVSLSHWGMHHLLRASHSWSNNLSIVQCSSIQLVLEQTFKWKLCTFTYYK